MSEPDSIKTLTNTGYSFLGYTLPIIFSIVITPIIVRSLGITDYGIYVLINSINGFLGLMDLGLGMSVVKYVAEYHARGETERLKKVVGSASALFFIFGALGAAVYFLISKYFLGFFHISPAQRADIAPVFMLAGFMFFVNSLATMPSNVLKAMQRYDLSVKISLLFLSLYNLSALALVLMHFHLKALFLANLFFAALALLCYLIIAARTVKFSTLHFNWSWAEVKRCYSFGLAAFVTNISNNTLSYVDRLVIPAYLSPAQLSFYSLPANVSDKITGITGTSTSVLFPMLSSLSASEQVSKIKASYIRIFRNVPIVTVALGLSIALFSRKILFYWLGAEFADKGAEVLVILAVTNALLGTYGVLQNFLLGFGKVKFLMKMSLCMAVLNVAGLLYLVPKYGILGAAWAYLISVLPVAFAFFWTESSFLQLNGRLGFYTKLLTKLTAVSLLVVIIFKFILDPLTDSLIALIVFGTASVILFLALYKLFGFLEAEDWDLYKRFLLKLGLKL